MSIKRRDSIYFLLAVRSQVVINEKQLINYLKHLVPSVLFCLIATGFVRQNDNINRRVYFYLLALKKSPRVFRKVLLSDFFESRMTQSSIHCTVIEVFL